MSGTERVRGTAVGTGVKPETHEYLPHGAPGAGLAESAAVGDVAAPKVVTNILSADAPRQIVSSVPRFEVYWTEESPWTFS